MKKLKLYKIDGELDEYFYRCWDSHNFVDHYYLNRENLIKDMLEYLKQRNDWYWSPAKYNTSEYQINGDGDVETRPIADTIIFSEDDGVVMVQCEVEYKVVKKEDICVKKIIDGQEYSRFEKKETLQQDWALLYGRVREKWTSSFTWKPFLFQRKFYTTSEELEICDWVE